MIFEKRENNKLQKVIGEVESYIDNKKLPKNLGPNSPAGNEVLRIPSQINFKFYAFIYFF